MGFEVEKEKRHQELWDPQPRSVSENGRNQSNSHSLAIAIIIFIGIKGVRHRDAIVMACERLLSELILLRVIHSLWIPLISSRFREDTMAFRE